jgi:alpha-mannosidase
MLNQFHDVLPGSSIEMVNEDARAIYAERIKQSQKLLDEALSAIFPGSSAMNGVVESKDQNIVILDPARLGRHEVIEITESIATLATTVTQRVYGQSSLALMRSGLEGIGHLVDNDGFLAPTVKQTGDVYELSNADFQLTISSGRITSLVDRYLERELITPGPGSENAGLVLYDDFPLAYDAWDAEVYHLECGRALKFDNVEIAAEGPLRASLRATCVFGKSRAVLTVRAPTDETLIVDIAGCC